MTGELAERLRRDRAAGWAGRRSRAWTRVSAGATQEIWRFVLRQGEGATPLVLRRAPGGERVSETAVGLETEARLIQAAAGADVPVPKVRYVFEESDGLGHGFVMEFVEGETLGGRIARGEALAAARPKLARQCGEILARIHRLDPTQFPTLRRATPAELVAQYKAAYRASAWPRPVFESGASPRRSSTSPCARDAARLVHGDFRNRNY